MAHNVLQEIYKAEHRLLDPGNGNAIVVLDKDLAYVPLVTTDASGETRTLDDPLKGGISLMLQMKTDKSGTGNCVVTADNVVDVAGNTIMTFDDEGDYIKLESIEIDDDTFRWRVISYDGATGVTTLATQASTYLDGVTVTFGTTLDFTLAYVVANAALTILPLSDDAGAIWIGDGTTDVDLKWWSGAAFVDFNVSTALVVFDAIDLQLGDNDKVLFGDASGGDVTMAWESADGEFHIDVAADDSVINIGDATLAADIYWFAGTGGDYVEFDASASVVNFVDVDIQLDDDAIIFVGDGNDLVLRSDGTDGSIDNDDNGSVLIGAANAASVKLSASAAGTFVKSRLVQFQPAITTFTNSNPLSDANMMSGIIEGTPTSSANYTTRTGTEIQSALEAIVGTIADDDSFELCIINLAAAGVGIITLVGGVGVTVKGSATIDDIGADVNSSGLFRFTRTASNVWDCHRIS